jgi:meckelin
VGRVYVQAHIDIFFIDWEKPRPSSNRRQLASTDEAAVAAAPTEAEEGSHCVSIWRTLFIANEWNELQTVG